MRMMTQFATVLFSLLSAVSAAGEAPTSLTFEQHVRPLLKARCFQCHGENEKTEGGLDVRLQRLLVAGGDSGAAIVPGKPDESYLLDRLKFGEMPPGEDSEKLSTDEIALIERWITAGAPTAYDEPEEIGPGLLITEAERSHWSFQPIRRPDVPEPKSADRVRTPIDAFLLARLEKENATFAPDADRRTLIRRAYFDLIGLPPSIEQLEAVLGDDSADWYATMIDRLLASPHYGERWGRHWLDVAGYADSDGHTGDDVRQHAYRYRDYVIRSFNDDKPLDQFIREQLAGDEMVGPITGEPTPEQAEKLIATGFLQMAPDGTATAEDRQAAHNQLVADTIKIVSTSLLGLSVGCARCHDHRFDPISQEDYYRFRAIFEPALNLGVWQGRRRLMPYSTEQDRMHAESLIQGQERAVIERVAEQQLAKLPEQQRATAREAFETPEAERSEQQEQLLVEAKLNVTADNLKMFDGRAAQELNRIRQRLAPLLKGSLQTVREAGGNPPKTFLFSRGNPDEPRDEVNPAELTILRQDFPADIPLNDSSLPSTGRRLAYARHLTDGKHPLVARVIVNRVWMQHFGRGLCTTPFDFGMQGDRPSHPELLDWLASEFMDGGWSLKRLHKRIMGSTAYRQGRRDAELVRIDPDNRLLGGFEIRRLEAEIVRDAILAVSGDLNPKAFGAAVPVMQDPAGEVVVGLSSNNAGVPLSVVPMFGEECRRSIYVQTRRTMPLTLLQMFDAPAMEPNCEARTTSTVAPQSLMLMNSPFILKQSLSFARRVRREAGDDAQVQVETAWKLAFARTPNAEEQADAAAFLKARTEYFRKHPPAAPSRKKVPGRSAMNMAPQRLDVLVESVSEADPELLALALFCQMLMSSNEFLYVG